MPHQKAAANACPWSCRRYFPPVTVSTKMQSGPSITIPNNILAAFGPMIYSSTIAASSYTGPPLSAPMDGIRHITEIPGGAGYVPQPGRKLDVYESAALRERARADHQNI